MAEVVQAGVYVRAEGRGFYVGLSSVCALTAFVGFAPTYWLPLVNGTLDVAPIRHVHGAIFFAWTLFLVLQATLVATGNTRRHRATGTLGAALAGAMVVTGILVAIHALHVNAANGAAEAGKAFSVVPLLGITLFAALIVASFANIRRPAVHKRLMIVATAGILQAAVARWFLLFLAPPGATGPPPVAVSLAPGLVVDLIIVAGMLYDWRVRGRPHPAYLAGGAAVLAVQILVIPISGSHAWLAFADWLLRVTA